MHPSNANISGLLNGPGGRFILHAWVHGLCRFESAGDPPFSAHELLLESSVPDEEKVEACEAISLFVAKYGSYDWDDQVVITRNPAEQIGRLFDENDFDPCDLGMFQYRMRFFSSHAHAIYVINGNKECFKFVYEHKMVPITAWNYLKFPVSREKVQALPPIVPVTRDAFKNASGTPYPKASVERPTRLIQHSRINFIKN
jgi:hypothetical protein